MKNVFCVLSISLFGLLAACGQDYPADCRATGTCASGSRTSAMTTQSSGDAASQAALDQLKKENQLKMEEAARKQKEQEDRLAALQQQIASQQAALSNAQQQVKNTGSTGSTNPLSTIGTSILGSVAGALTGALTGAITNSIGGSSQPSQQQTQTQTQQSGGSVSFPSTISGATQTASLDCYKNPLTCITL